MIMNNYDVFISYRRDGGDALAGRISDRLSMLGYTVFFDVETMRYGDFDKQILTAIENSENIIVILPPNGLDRCFNDNDWVRQEIAHALKFNKNIVPVMMQGFDFPLSLPPDIDEFRKKEGLSVINEYFDAAIERLQNRFVNRKTAPNRVENYNNQNKPMFIRNVCSLGSNDFNNAFPHDGLYTQSIDRDKYKIIYFHLTTMRFAKKKIKSKVKIYDENDYIVFDEEYEYDWKEDYCRISNSWVIVGKDSFIKTGIYRAVFTVDNSAEYEYKFIIRSAETEIFFKNDNVGMIEQQKKKEDASIRRLSWAQVVTSVLSIIILATILYISYNIVSIEKFLGLWLIDLIIVMVLNLCIAVKITKSEHQSIAHKIIIWVLMVIGQGMFIGVAGLIYTRKKKQS